MEDFGTSAPGPSETADGERREGGTPSEGEQRDLAPGLEGAPFDRVRDAWAEARARCDPELPALTDALRALARHARGQGVPVAQVLKALDAVIHSDRGGEPDLDWDHVREISGRVAIRAFYHDD